MKTIKLFSALALTLATATAVSTVASAETTNSSVELLTDTGSGATMILPTDPEKLGTDLPGASKWAGSLGAEYTQNAKFFGNIGKFFVALDGYARSEFSSSPSASKYLVISNHFSITFSHLYTRSFLIFNTSNPLMLK